MKPNKCMPLFLLLVLALSGWLPSGCSPPEPPTLYVPVKGEFTCLVMTFPEEGNFDKFEFVTKRYKRIYWEVVDENPIRSSSSSRPD